MARRKRKPRPKRGEYSDAILASELEHRARAIQSPAYAGQSRHLADWIDLNAYATQVSGELWQDRSVGTACRAFSVVHTQWMALMRSVMSLNDQGRYGPAAGLVRTIYERTDLITYLCQFPAEAEDWSESTRTPPTDPRHKAARETFAWPKIRRSLRDAGLQPTTNKAIRELNNAVHPSEWGLRFYALRRVPGAEMENVIGLSPTVVFDLVTAFWIGRLLHNIAPLPIRSLLHLCEVQKVRKSAWRPLHGRYEELLRSWETYRGIHDKFASLMTETEQRVLAGEPVDEVTGDIESRVLHHMEDGSG